MGLLSAVFFAPILVIGVAVGSPAILGVIGLGAAGPIAGTAFAAAQGAGIAAGSWMAAGQAIAMIAALPMP